MARMTDDELRMLADSQPRGPSWIRDVLLELLEHRARIAAHATAHPDRLSDKALCDLSFHMMNEIIDHLDHDGGIGLSVPNARTVVAALLEIQQRRAADLTPPEINALKEWREELIANALEYDPGATTDTIPVIDKILAAHGVSP